MLSRLISRPWFWVLAIGFLFALPLVRVFTRTPPKLPSMRGEVPEFSLTRESGAPFGSRELAAKVWVVSRFTTDEKRPGMHAMLELERRMRKLGDAFELVSLSDQSPAELAAWARGHKSNPRRWALLGGAPAELARVRAALKLDTPGASSDNELVLIDQHLRIRGFYDAGPEDKETLEQLIYDAALLVNDY